MELAAVAFLPTSKSPTTDAAATAAFRIPTLPPGEIVAVERGWIGHFYTEDG